MEEKRTDHSRNPEKSYEIIEGMYPEAKKIEIFAKFVYPDWTGIGLEAQPKTYTKFEKKMYTIWHVSLLLHLRTPFDLNDFPEFQKVSSEVIHYQLPFLRIRKDI